MARTFVDSSSQYLSNANAAVTGFPITMACWFQTDDLGASGGLISIADSSVTNHKHFINFAQAGDLVAAQSQAGGSLASASIGTVSLSTWTHAAGTFSGAASRFAFLNGTKSTENTASRSPTGLNQTVLGAQGGSTISTFLSGVLAECGIWNVVLTDAEIAALARGVPARRVRPSALKFYVPIWGKDSPEPDYGGQSLNMTLNGSPAQAPHAPVGPAFGLDDSYAFPTAVAGLGADQIMAALQPPRTQIILPRRHAVAYE